MILIIKIALTIIALVIILWALFKIVISVMVFIVELKDNRFITYLKYNEPDKYTSIVIKYQDNPVRMKTVLHAYKQELEDK